VQAAGRVPGTVLVQYPAADSAADTGTEVALQVAGPEPGTVMPDVVGLRIGDARRALESYGLTAAISVVRELSTARATENRGVVWLQSPAAGEILASPVTLLVNP